jgi:hypothetical protein
VVVVVACTVLERLEAVEPAVAVLLTVATERQT